MLLLKGQLLLRFQSLCSICCFLISLKWSMFQRRRSRAPRSATLYLSLVFSRQHAFFGRPAVRPSPSPAGKLGRQGALLVSGGGGRASEGLASGLLCLSLSGASPSFCSQRCWEPRANPSTSRHPSRCSRGQLPQVSYVPCHSQLSWLPKFVGFAFPPLWSFCLFFFSFSFL